MTSVTIRDLPGDVRDTLAARAAREGRSLQEHLRLQLISMARRPTASDWVDDVRRRKAATQRRGPTVDEILSWRDEGRR